MSPYLNLDVSHDATRAVLKFADTRMDALPSLEAIKSFLNRRKVCEGVHMKSIQDSLQNGDAEIEVAWVQRGRIAVKGFGEIRSREEFVEFKRSLSQAGQLLEGRVEARDDIPLVFHLKGDEVLSGVLPARKNIFGKVVELFNPLKLLPATKVFETSGNAKERAYVAKYAGFLYINAKGELDSYPLLRFSEDEIDLEARAIRPTLGQEYLEEHLEQQRLKGEWSVGRAELRKMAQSRELKKLVVKKGQAPVQGKNAELDWHVPHGRMTSSEDTKRVDYREQRVFHEAYQGQKIMTKRPIVPHRDGVTADGRVLKVVAKALQDVAVNAGINVEVRENPSGELEYFAQHKGIVQFKDQTLSVIEVLTIKGDVGMHSGNIAYSGDVVVKENVNSGSRIVCGGDLIIEGGVEDKVEITCAGNLTVKRGVMGSSTRIEVKGEADLGFVQDATISSEKSLMVRKYAFNAKLYALGLLSVAGEGQRGEDRGAVVGGLLNSLTSLRVHSVGSDTNVTKLCAGINLRILEKHEWAKNYKKLILKRMQRVQDALGFDITSPHVLSTLSRIKGRKGELIKEKLHQLREMAIEHDKIQKQIEFLEKYLYSPQLEEESVVIESGVMGDLQVSLARDTMLERNKVLEKLEYRKSETGIVKIN